MKKLFSYLLYFILVIGLLPSLIACVDESEEPVYNDIYTYNDTHHWKAQINGDGDPIEYGEHYNPPGEKCGRCKCGYYFECINLVYEKTTVDGVEGYKVVDYDEYMSPNFYHVEVPKYHQEPGDTEPLPVISIGQYALSNRVAPYGRCDIKLESIKLNEGLLRLETGVFCYSNVEEIVIPNSVKGDLVYTVMYSPRLKRVVVGNGVTRINGYVFTGCDLLEEVIFGNSVTEITPRNFIYVSELKRVVLPASLVSIPETALMGNTNTNEVQYLLIEDKDVVYFMEITKQQHDELIIPRKLRDEMGNVVNEDERERTTYGFVDGWSGLSKVYFKDEWHYDQNGVPVPNE